jgi:hypothetical protein
VRLVAHKANPPPGSRRRDEKPKSALDAVLKVLKKPAAAAPTADKATQAPPASGGRSTRRAQGGRRGREGLDQPEEYAKLPPVVRRRIGRLTSERNEARDR